MEQSEQRNSSISAGDQSVPSGNKPNKDNQIPNIGTSNRWSCLSGCLFDYSSRASIDQNKGSRHLQSSIIIKPNIQNSQEQSRLSETTTTQNEEQKVTLTAARNSNNQNMEQQPQQHIPNPLSVKQDNTNSLNNQAPSPSNNQQHHEAASGSIIYSYDNSGMNSPIETKNNNGNMALFGQSRIYQNPNNTTNDSSKLMACSLDASNIEALQRMIERKQVINHREQQTLNQLVNQYFPQHGKIFILRDKLNQYNTLASASYKQFTIHGAAPAYSSITQSVFVSQTIPVNNIGNSINTNISNGSTGINNNNLNTINSSNGNNNHNNNNNSNRAATVIANTNLLLKPSIQLKDSQQQQQQSQQQQQLLQASLQNPEFLCYKNLYSKPLKLDLDYHDMFTPEKIALYIAEQYKKYTLVIDACCGIGGNTIQFSKVNKMVIAVDRNPRALQNCVENVKLYRPERNVNVDFICEDFLKISLSDYCALRADFVFIHPHIELSSDPTIKPDLFKHSKPNLLKAMRHAYKIAKNFAVLLPNSIDITQIPIVMDRFYRSLPTGMISHHCPHIEVLLLNGGVKYFLITIGDAQKYKQDDEFDFMQSLIREYSYYPKGAYEQRVLELLHTVERKVGMKKLVNSLIKSIDSNDLDSQKNLLKKFSDEMHQDKILTNQEIKKILNVGDAAQTGQQQQNQFDNNLLNIDGMLSHSPRLQTQSHSIDNSSNNINFNNFDMSYTSQHSGFVLEMQYGSKQSQDMNPISPSQLINKEKSLSYDRNQSKASLFPLIDSTLGDKKNLEEEDDYGFEDEYDDDEDGNGKQQNNDGRSNLDDDFYFNEHQNDLLDQKKPFPFNPNNQLNTL